MPDGNLILEPAAMPVRPDEVRAPVRQHTERVPVTPPATPAAAQARGPQVQVEDFTTEELRDVVAAFGEVVSLVNRELRIRIDESTGRIVTEILDGETNEVVRQLPPEALLDVARRVADLVGLLLDEER